MSAIATRQLMTTGQIARAIGVSLGVARYVIDQVLMAEPVARVGILRQYEASIVDDVRAELAKRADRLAARETR